ncbi:hypothetical protein [Dinghuibacter silviterrae]|uniref:Outer membrane protein with beta-barrel domain n=1 Tax=Dinghuibacter silviterrae TaxID=1539049 RepID=A0A4R8DSW5_9BACT|nr:hypothetical protein [Dinghuibacter silviterrae]TDX00966.1 hypothetical protein EDB95_1997 [Dinghuibacter silviterrae]
MKKYLAVLLVGLHPFLSDAQAALSFKDAKTEIGIDAGPSFFLGDLGGNFKVRKGFVADLNFPSTRYFVGVNGLIYPSPWLGLRGSLNFGELYGNDAYSSSSDDGRKIRNLDFRTTIWEAFVGLEAYPLDLIFPDDDVLPIRPYFVAGVGVFHFNPQGTYRDPTTGQTTWIDLRPLHTEGEGFGPGFPKEYSLWQPNVPLGVGARMDLSDKVSLGGELLYRVVFTGYIDDVHNKYIDPSLFYQHMPAAEAAIAAAMANKSTEPWNWFTTRGDPNRTNAYFSLVLSLRVQLSDGGSWFERASAQTRCPTRW